MESWKPIKQFEGVYEVSDFGGVRRIRHGPGEYRQLKITNMRGYGQVNLIHGKQRATWRVHRLVLEAFADVNFTVLPKSVEVHHKNKIKNDNRLENLQLVLHSRHIAKHNNKSSNLFEFGSAEWCKEILDREFLEKKELICVDEVSEDVWKEICEISSTFKDEKAMKKIKKLIERSNK